MINTFLFFYIQVHLTFPFYFGRIPKSNTSLVWWSSKYFSNSISSPLSTSTVIWRLTTLAQPEMFWMWQFLDYSSDILKQYLWEQVAGICFSQQSWWFSCTRKFGNDLSNRSNKWIMKDSFFFIFFFISFFKW